MSIPMDDDDFEEFVDMVEGPWKAVCIEMDVMEIRHTDGRSGYAEWVNPKTPTLIFRDNAFTTDEQEELTTLITDNLPMGDVE